MQEVKKKLQTWYTSNANGNKNSRSAEKILKQAKIQ
jgi:hypothetical protein